MTFKSPTNHKFNSSTKNANELVHVAETTSYKTWAVKFTENLL